MCYCFVKNEKMLFNFFLKKQKNEELKNQKQKIKINKPKIINLIQTNLSK